MNRREIVRGLIGLSALLSLRIESLAAFMASIERRKIPSTGENLPVVGVGTWQTFDVGASDSERQPLLNVLQELIKYGGSVIDSSPMYGRSEGVVGDLAQRMEIVDKLFMATKVWTNGRDQGIKQMEQSMSRMKKSPIDLMQIHNLVDWKTHIKTLQALKEEGRIRYIGITHYIESAYDNMESIMKNYPIDFIQLNYSIISRTAEKSILPLAKEKGIAVIVNRPYEGGTLFRKIKGKKLPEWTAEFDCNSWGQFFLKFILSHESINCVIPGTSKAHHMIDNLGAGLGRLPNQQERQKMVKIWTS